METGIRYLFGAVAALVGIFAPVGGMIACALVFVTVDFFTGVAASYHRAKRCGVPWSFESRRAWDTVRKAVFIVAGIALSWLVDGMVLGFADLHIANLFTGFVCGVELWSFLENGAEVCDYPPFRWLRRFMYRQLTERLGGSENLSGDDRSDIAR